MIALIVMAGAALMPRTPAEAEFASVGGLIGRIVLSMAIVLGLMGALYFLYRRLQKRGRGKGTGYGIDVEARKALGRNSWVALLSMGERKVLIGVTQQRITRLGSWRERAREEGRPRGTRPADFSSALENRMSRLKDLGFPVRISAAEPGEPVEEEIR